MGLGNSLFWPTAQAFVQEIVNENEYFSANSLLSASYQVGSILGAGIGGFIVHFFSPISALWINGFAYLISGIFIGIAPFKRSTKSSIRENIIKSLSKGFSFLKKRKDVLFVGLSFDFQCHNYTNNKHGFLVINCFSDVRSNGH